MGYEQFHVSFGGSVPFAVYMTVQRLSDQLWFRPATGTFTARTGGDSPVPYRLPLTNTGGDSFVLTVPPAVDLPATTGGVTYGVNYYNQLTDPATDSDDLLLSEEVGWNGEDVVEPSDAAGLFASDNDLDAYLAAYNVTLYSDRDGDNARDVGTIQQAFDVTDRQIVAPLSAVYATPLEWDDGVPAEVLGWSVRLTACWLVENRLITNVQNFSVADIRRDVFAEIGLYACGQFPAYTLAATRAYAETNAPRTDETTGVHLAEYPTGEYLTATW